MVSRLLGFVGFMLLLGLTVTQVLSVDADAAPKKYETYSMDNALFEKHGGEFQEFRVLAEMDDRGEVPLENLKRRLEIVRGVLKAEPGWIDGYWLLAERALAFVAGSSEKTGSDFQNEATALTIENTERCLKARPDHPLCKFFLGIGIARSSAANGYFSSLRRASQVEKLWREVYESSFDYRFSAGSTLQGRVRYALGQFYRLVPSAYWVRWFYNVSGDAKEAVRYLTEATEHDGRSPCRDLMLAASQVCLARTDGKQSEIRSATMLLKSVAIDEPRGPMDSKCIGNSKKILSDQELACQLTSAD